MCHLAQIHLPFYSLLILAKASGKKKKTKTTTKSGSHVATCWSQTLHVDDSLEGFILKKKFDLCVYARASHTCPQKPEEDMGSPETGELL